MEMILEISLHLAFALVAAISFNLAKKYYLSGIKNDLAKRVNNTHKQKRNISF